ncbi:MAG: hypothetical protein IPI43_28170 [Sandaracinaceae bacterium]|nr:hypothetical protein [Sandaracinaceae bacterium]
MDADRDYNGDVRHPHRGVLGIPRFATTAEDCDDTDPHDHQPAGGGIVTAWTTTATGARTRTRAQRRGIWTTTPDQFAEPAQPHRGHRAADRRACCCPLDCDDSTALPRAAGTRLCNALDDGYNSAADFVVSAFSTTESTTATATPTVAGGNDYDDRDPH